MLKNERQIFSNGEWIDDEYQVQFFIKRGANAETYRVKDPKGDTNFLKLFDYAKLHRSQFDRENRITEIEYLKELTHPNIVSYRDSGDLNRGSRKFAYLVLDFISGETLSQKMQREDILSVYKATHIAKGILEGLDYLHSQDEPIIHNEITNQNIMLDLSRKNGVPVLIDFGYARSFNQSAKAFNKEGLNPFYLAPECFNSIFSPQSDLYSVGALLYHLIFGIPPWHTEISNYKSERYDIEEILLQERNKPLSFSSIYGETKGEVDQDLENVISIALSPDVDKRFRTAREFIQALNGNLELHDMGIQSHAKTPVNACSKKEFTSDRKGKGFDLIAGMDELKETIYNDVIRALEEKELYEEYGLNIPNGMLLYGPPGCGKTYFAERLAEEVGFYFITVKPSDLASIYVHGSQEKIGKLFNTARKHAPAIIFFDELDALVPNREDNLSHSYAEGVNEFLSQMTNCADDGIFVIGATNRPDKIDPALLRTGRIDKLFNVPPPDSSARVALFELYLDSRPVEAGVDYEKLSELTAGYISSDIKYLVNESARLALKNKSKINHKLLEDTIHNNDPSISANDLNKYEEIGRRLKGIGEIDSENKIGF